ncbi:MAG: YciI family protein [Anaeromyxobacter sp.]
MRPLLALAACLALALEPRASPATLAPASAAAAPAAPAPAAPPGMEAVQLVLLLRPEGWKPLPDAEAQAIQAQHLAHLQKMGAAGKLLVAGPFDDQRDPVYRGACIYRVGSVEEARALAEQDPAVRAGRLRVEVLTWWTEKGYMTFPRAPAP